jgi:hypothetical protein
VAGFWIWCGWLFTLAGGQQSRRSGPHQSIGTLSSIFASFVQPRDRVGTMKMLEKRRRRRVAPGMLLSAICATALLSCGDVVVTGTSMGTNDHGFPRSGPIEPRAYPDSVQPPPPSSAPGIPRVLAPRILPAKRPHPQAVSSRWQNTYAPGLSALDFPERPLRPRQVTVVVPCYNCGDFILQAPPQPRDLAEPC